MDDLANFLAMGGYARFVWPAYGVAAAVMIGLLAASIARLRREERALERLAAANPRRGASRRRDAAAEAGP
jgi:heme exporter protein D